MVQMVTSGVKISRRKYLLISKLNPVGVGLQNSTAGLQLGAGRICHPYLNYLQEVVYLPFKLHRQISILLTLN